jgi:hypothetical protein
MSFFNQAISKLAFQSRVVGIQQDASQNPKKKEAGKAPIFAPYSIILLPISKKNDANGHLADIFRHKYWGKKEPRILNIYPQSSSMPNFASR